MHTITTSRVCRFTLAALLVGAAAAPSVAAQEANFEPIPRTFELKSCAAAPNGDSQAWELKEKPDSKMVIGRDCLPGRGAGGIITRSAAQKGYAPARARAYAVMEVPAGMEIRRLVWGGQMWRYDCDWTAELYAVYPNGAKQRIYEKPCRDKTDLLRVAKFRVRSIAFKPDNEYLAGHYPIQVIQRVRCLARRCKTTAFRTKRGRAPRVDVRTFHASAAVQDVQPPVVAVAHGEGLASSSWLRGDQSVRFEASDASGIHRAAVEIAGAELSQEARDCYWARLLKAPPCPNGSGQLSVDTKKLPDGHHIAQIAAADSAGNVGRLPFDVYIDNTPPDRVAVGVEGGDHWRNQNGFGVGWQNPPEANAPINGALYQTRALGQTAWSAPKPVDGAAIARIGGVEVPAGQTELRLWRRDQAGNEIEQNASDPVILRYDPETPQLGFEASPPDDPTKVSVAVTEKVSGIAGGQIELSREGSGVWQTLPTQPDGARLVARIADEQLPPGRYVMRAQATDLAGNVGVTSATQAINLPLRIQSKLTGGIEETKTVRKKVKRRGKRRTVPRRVTTLHSSGRLGYGDHATITGRLTNPDGQPLVGQEIRVLATVPGGAEQLAAVVQTDGEGRYSYRALGSHTRALRLVYLGTPLMLPVQTQVTLTVPAAASIHAKPRRVRNGQSVKFAGRLRSLPAPAAGKLVELQVVLSGRWQTFRTIRTDPAGAWRASYSFRRTCGLLRYRFRARLPAEAGYPFETGHTRAVAVRVRGRPCR